jgi:hypothetical protein
MEHCLHSISPLSSYFSLHYHSQMSHPCFVESDHCSGIIYQRLFIWHHSFNEPVSCINVECALCQGHFNLLLELHGGVVPEMTGDTILSAINSIFYCIYIYDEI